MITIKGKDEAALVARIEKELKGEEVDIFQSDDVDYSMEQVLAFLGYNAKQTRVYIGRIERNSRKLEENLRGVNELLLPLAMYFSYLCEETLPMNELTLKMRQNKKLRDIHASNQERMEARRAEDGSPKAALEKQKETQKRMEDEGLVPKQK